MKLKKIVDAILPANSMEVHTDRRYLLQRKTTGEYYAGGNIHAPTTTMDKEKAAVLSGEKIKNIKYNWPMSWDLIDLSDGENLGGERVNELHFTGQMLSVVRDDIMKFLSSEHKKLGYPNPLDTYHLIQQIMDSPKVYSKIKGLDKEEVIMKKSELKELIKEIILNEDAAARYAKMAKSFVKSVESNINNVGQLDDIDVLEDKYSEIKHLKKEITNAINSLKKVRDGVKKAYKV